MALKLDISKAYDKVSHDLFSTILTNLGYNERVLRIITNVVTFVTFLVIVNEALNKFLSSSQGDPLSPYLIIVVVEVLRIFFVSLSNSSRIKGMKLTSQYLPQALQ